ncbi:MAG: hypothetical protein WB870_06650 [Gallionellaceae bacterium]
MSTTRELLLIPLASVIVIVLACVRQLFRGCPHQELGWPIGGKQHCNTCGAVRTYIMGEKAGPWYRETP